MPERKGARVARGRRKATTRKKTTQDRARARGGGRTQDQDRPLALIVNGETRTLVCPAHRTLLEILREDLGLTGTKHGCELGECGACTVLIDGRPVLSCLVLGVECEDRRILTVEGLAEGPRLHPLQETFAELGAAQCGYCTPGILCAAKALLDGHPEPSRPEIRAALSGNLCRCTGYIKIFEAVELAARRLKDPGAKPARETLHGRRD
jgi:carbon-monoxide dehydrogenase small subunit